MNITVRVLMGLPGSGKSTFAEQHKKENPNVYIIDLDREKDYFWNKKVPMEELLGKAIRTRPRKMSEIIVDGLILTRDDLYTCLDTIAPYFDNVDVIIEQWNEDRETCIKNDGGRREISSTRTILNAQYDIIDKDEFNAYIVEKGYADMKITHIHRHTVMLKPDWLRFFRANTWYDDDGKFRSQKWCTGGTAGDCWGGMSSVSPDETPDFTALDELLEKVAPQLTFLQYKKIKRECVSIEESSESDYYAGVTHHQRWVCDLKKMYELLEEMGYSELE